MAFGMFPAHVSPDRNGGAGRRAGDPRAHAEAQTSSNVQLVVQKFGGSSLGEAARIRRVAQRIAGRARGRGPRRRRLGDGRHDGRAPPAGRRDHRRPRSPRARHAPRDRRAPERDPRLDGPPRARREGDLADRRAGGHHHGREPWPSAHRERRASPRPRRARQRQRRDRRRLPGAKRTASRVGASAGEPGETTTLGRGGSDTTAVALAAALRADRCQIFTDVRGIYTADPRLVPDARQLSTIGYEEMLELAQQGAQVMQVRAVELGWINDVEIEVLSSFEDAPGTLIREDPLVEQRNKVRGWPTTATWPRSPCSPCPTGRASPAASSGRSRTPA